ncbi:MAG: cytochrome-c peroxidase, partial [Paracoccaceae bacterium]
MFSAAFAILLWPLSAIALDFSLLPNPVEDSSYLPTTTAEVELGQLLFWDKILSGNKSISCGTCHHPRFGSSDGVSLGFGDGGIGVGPNRVADPKNYPEQRVPRNSPSLYNTGALEYTALFADGRIEVDRLRPAGIRSPLEEDMMSGFASILSAQTMFPVLSPD